MQRFSWNLLELGWGGGPVPLWNAVCPLLLIQLCFSLPEDGDILGGRAGCVKWQMAVNRTTVREQPTCSSTSWSLWIHTNWRAYLKVVGRCHCRQMVGSTSLPKCASRQALMSRWYCRMKVPACLHVASLQNLEGQLLWEGLSKLQWLEQNDLGSVGERNRCRLIVKFYSVDKSLGQSPAGFSYWRSSRETLKVFVFVCKDIILST